MSSSLYKGVGNVRSDCASGLGVFVSVTIYIWLWLMDLLTPTMATLSMVFLKPAGWSLAYLDIMIRLITRNV